MTAPLSDHSTDRTPLEPAISPYLYELLWSLAVHGPLTAAEMAEDHNRPHSVQRWQYWNARDVANRLRGPQRRGLVERDEHGIWLLSEAGRAWMRAESGPLGKSERCEEAS